MYIKTLNYGNLPIAKSKKWLHNEVFDIIEEATGIIYEIRETLNGQLVAYKLV